MNARLTITALALITTGLLSTRAKAQDAPPAPAQQAPVQPQTLPAPQPETQEAAPPPPTQREAGAEAGKNFEPNEIRAWSMLTEAAKPVRT